MATRLRPTDIPSRVEPAQIIDLPDGRLLARGPRGLSVLGGVALRTLERVLAQIDGKRTLGEICDALGGEASPRDIARLVTTLDGDVLVTARRQPSALAPEPPRTVDLAGRVLILGNGPAGRHLADSLPARLADPTSLEEHALGQEISRSKLVICGLEKTPYHSLFRIQARSLAAGVPSLFVTFDPDGTRVGPAVLPRTTPCLACAQIAGLRFLGLPIPDLLSALRRFETRELCDRELLSRIAQLVRREARSLLLGRSRLFASMLLIRGEHIATVEILPVAGCPLCEHAEPIPRTDAGRSTDLPGSGALRRRAERRVLEIHEAAPRRAHPAEEEDLVTTVGVVGGGTAGYLAALALRRRFPRLDVTLIESPAVPIIGVGEATTPLMPQFLHVDLGLDVRELFREVQPTLKLGIRFEWGLPDGAFNYPFGPNHTLEARVHDGDLRQASLQSVLMSAGAVNVERGVATDASDPILGVETAYHLDNARLAAYLRRKARELGVRVIEATLEDIDLEPDGESVRGLVADDGRRFAFDFYIDCTGFRSLLIGDALGSPFLDYARSLPTDGAVVAEVPHKGLLKPYTTAETMASGWCWSTPQRAADHRGYVFCAAFSTPAEAEREMRRLNPGMGEARLVRFSAGRRAHFWRGNVAALGNAYAFVEPLESTALHMLIRQIGLLLGAFPLRRGDTSLAPVLNRKVGAFWDYLRWFLAIHYRFNRRLDTPFWRHCRREADVSGHIELIDIFRRRGPLAYDRAVGAAFDYPDPLWGAEGIDVLLLGQGVESSLPRPALGKADWDRRTELFHAIAGGSMPQAEALELFDREPALLDCWAEAFRRVGAAFP